MKKYIAIIAFIMLIMTPFQGIYANDNSGFLNGDGTKDNPYIITNEEDLNIVRNNLDKSFKLANDIVLTKEWIPIGSDKKPFTGLFNGNYFSIYKMKIKSDYNIRYAGLFGYADKATISNLGVEIVTINNGKSYSKDLSYNMGGLVGYSNESKITSCNSSGNITISNQNLDGEDPGIFSSVGGLIGCSNKSTIEKCFSTVNVTNTLEIAKIDHIKIYTGGLVGSNIGTINNCHAIGDVFSNMMAAKYEYCDVYTGGLAGLNQEYITCSYETGNVTSKMNRYKYSSHPYIGGFAGFNLGVITTSYSTGKVTWEDITINSETAGYSFYTYEGLFAGKNSGAVSYCYSIGTGGTNFICLVENNVIKSCYFDKEKAQSNETLGKSSTDMKNISTYEGWDFDYIWSINANINNGYPYLNLRAKPTFSYSGGEGTTQNPYLIKTETDLCNVKLNLDKAFKLENDIVLTRDWEPIGNLENPFKGSFYGNNFKISNIKFSLKPDLFYAGLFGYTYDAVISNLGVEMDLNYISNYYFDSLNIGALAGYSHKSNIENCCSNGKINMNFSYISDTPPVRVYRGNPENCFDGDIKIYSGGLIGYNNSGKIENCFSTTLVTNKLYIENIDKNIQIYSGGLIANNSESTINNCFATGNITSEVKAVKSESPLVTYTGGLCGFNQGNISKSNSSGNVTGYSLGENISLAKTGGFAGYNYKNITNCYSKGNIVSKTEGKRPRGVGMSYHMNPNSMYVSNDCGVFAGINNGTISYCYSSSGGCLQFSMVYGYFHGKFESCYFDKEKAQSNETLGKSSTDMKNKNTYEGWDFDTVWNIDISKNDGYPFLKSLQ